MAKTFPMEPERTSREERALALNSFKMEASWTGLGWWKAGFRMVLRAGLGGSEPQCFCIGQKSLLGALKWSLDAAGRALPFISCGL